MNVRNILIGLVTLSMLAVASVSFAAPMHDNNGNRMMNMQEKNCMMMSGSSRAGSKHSMTNGNGQHAGNHAANSMATTQHNAHSGKAQHLTEGIDL